MAPIASKVVVLSNHLCSNFGSR